MIWSFLSTYNKFKMVLPGLHRLKIDLLWPRSQPSVQMDFDSGDEGEGEGDHNLQFMLKTLEKVENRVAQLDDYGHPYRLRRILDAVADMRSALQRYQAPREEPNDVFTPNEEMENENYFETFIKEAKQLQNTEFGQEEYERLELESQ